MPIFLELSIIIAIATAIAFLMQLLRQPLIVGYIATGILAGPYFLNLLQSREEMELFSKIGISILLFIVGLTLNPNVVREVGRVSSITGIGQIIFTSAIGFVIVMALGFDTTASFYIAIALTFSSTIIILKLLSDGGHMGKLFGKISIGFLLVQDLVATIMLVAVTAVGANFAYGQTEFLSTTGLKIVELVFLGAFITLALYWVSKYILPALFRSIAHSQELLFIFSIAWGLGLASLFHAVGFSIEVGALIAGVLLAVSPFSYEMSSRVKPLRDFFIIIFFVLLGAQMILGQFELILIPALILSAFVLIGNPLIVIIIMNALGYRTKTAFMCGLTVAQISEFSLILVALGYSLGHIDQIVVSLVTLVGIITITGSTYLIIYAENIYSRIGWLLKIILPRSSMLTLASLHEDQPDIIIFGYDRVGNDFVSASRSITSNFLVVDYNPDSIKRLEELRIPNRYGDADDLEFLQEIGFLQTRMIISSIPDHMTNLLLVRHYRSTNRDGIIIVWSHRAKDAMELYDAGASYVVVPHHLGGRFASEMIKKYGFDNHGFDSERQLHLDDISNRIESGMTRQLTN
jgi:Kef-type K+ transport system membrane component KefB